MLAGGSAPFEERFYTQPGYPTDPRNASVRPARRRLAFTLGDTPATLRAKEAGRAGMSVEGYAQAMLAGGGPLAGGGSGASAGTLAPGTFAAAARDALSAEDEAFFAAGHDEDALLATIQQYQRIVDEYAAIDNKVSPKRRRRAPTRCDSSRDDCPRSSQSPIARAPTLARPACASLQTAAAGVVKAKAAVADAVAKLARLRAVSAKVAAVASDFDARSVARHAPLA